MTSLVGIWVTLRELRQSRTRLRTLVESAHQGLKTVFYQDLVIAVGCTVALAGLVIVLRTHQSWVDGAAASLQGFLLVVTGLFLSGETRGYLVGRALTPSLSRELSALARRDVRVHAVRSLQSMVLGPEEGPLALRLNF